jgi:hypothetical protein
MEAYGYLAGFVTLALIWLIVGVSFGKFNPFEVIIGKDNRPSASKFQFFLWTIVVIFCFMVIWFTKFMVGESAILDEIHPNLLLAMGHKPGA